MTRQEEKRLEREFFDLASRLDSQDERIRADADATLKSLPIHKLNAVWDIYRRRQKTTHTYLLLSSLGIAVVAIAAAFSQYPPNPLLFLGAILAPVVLFAIAGFHPYLGAVDWKRTIKILTRSEDVRVITPLIQLLPDADIVATLTRLLPRLQPADAEWFRQEDRNRLRDTVFSFFSYSRSKLAESFLRGMAAIGDRDTLANIAQLIIRDAPTAEGQRLRDVAWECLPILQANAFGNRIEEIPALIESLPAVPVVTTGMGAHKQYIAVLGLAYLLPRLTEKNASLLTPEHRKRLCANLGGLNLKEDVLTISRLGADFSLAAISALERFGSAESLPVLERCAEGKYSLWQLSPQDEKRVREAAAHALPAVQSRADAERESDTLLRGSQAPEPSGDTLLRPASYAPQGEPQQLLRASVSAADTEPEP